MEVTMITCGFIGLGLIGGSIARAFKQNRKDIRIAACDPDPTTRQQALSEGIADAVSDRPSEILGDCDFIFLCAPVAHNDRNLKQALEFCGPDCILTDVGSVKTPICRLIEELGLQNRFIGGHPMAGSERIGFANSKASLLENAYYILTPGEGVPEETFRDFYQLVKQMGAIPLPMSPDKHDFSTAAISHLPHVVAASLVNLVREADDENATLKTIAAGGFRDITRIASSSPVMWQNICLTNQREILHLLDLYLEKLQTFRTELANADSENLLAEFQSAKDYRDNLPIHQPGILPSVYEFYCDLIDEAGGIATIATILATNQLSIKNIGIIHNREYQDGVLHIEMYDQPSLEAAVALLQRNHYTIHL